ncbi:ABC transporter substrate-binding protein [Actinomadura macrotermitis]|uniref:Glutathione-binding protein GsiB n=1 Tax=Actinomadura macrotermitis TaxID=2585200 RepID=A0A7K0C5F1_9ACTN|nr:ABC transporter substrate-binding protein [Actinomadura macrotermitis]MQY08665.1 Glutathione-binding protein GsiB [Actinomadura macrotermitis]
MAGKDNGAKLIAGMGVLSLALAACGGGGGDGGGSGDEGGAPKKGGILKIVGSSDPDHVDTASSYSTVGQALSRNYARPLFGTKSSNKFDEAVPLQPDAAEALPTKENGGISGDGKTYTIKVRSGIMWNTQPAREVTAADFVRGYKRLCNPASPSGAQPYWRTTIDGMDEYCAAFAKVDAKSAKAIADYQNKHEVRGLLAKDDRTLVIKLKQPASDLLNILAMQFGSAAPKEYDNYIPDSPEFRKHTISDGPYQITSYTPNKSFVLGRNPAWKAETDPMRPAYIDGIQLTLGQDSPDAVQQQLEQGTADLAWDHPVPTSAIPRLKRDKDPGFAIRSAPSSNPYLVFNTLSPNNNGALKKKEVRQAIEYAIDKSALVKIYGGPDVSEPLGQVIPPGNVGYVKYDAYPTPNSAGDPAKCKQMLAAAGYPNGLKLKFPYRVSSNHPKVAQSIKDNLAGCGITADISPDNNGNFYGTSLVTPANAKEGKWDIAAPGWQPDWYGNNGRSIIQPLFEGRSYGPNSTNYGGYNNPEVDKLIDQALQAPDQNAAAEAWHKADQLIMQDAAVVPFMNQNFTIYHSKRVKNAQFIPTLQAYDFTKLWLAS